MNSQTQKNFLSPPRASPKRAHPEPVQITKVKSRLFTLHQPFTTYHYDIKKEKNRGEQCEQLNAKKLFFDVFHSKNRFA
ncbi:hypothetical protein [Enterobacter sp. 22466]|uniref:hypothetical protein n=1 Tax=Enterobacter sp. 22466 TaxID=3453924 RepID=UPI003F84DDBA